MGYIKEPKNIDFVVKPIEYTEQERKITSEALRKYRQNGEFVPFSPKRLKNKTCKLRTRKRSTVLK